MINMKQPKPGAETFINSKNVIVVPVGIPLNYHENYDKDNHWRSTKGEERDYSVVAYSYNDCPVEDDSYDIIQKDTGFKWEMVKHFLETYDYRDYEYIGFWDDDLVTDIKNVNRGLEIAKEENIKIFQLSTMHGSECSHNILHQDTSMKYSLTNFNEGMAVFIHSSLIPKILKFMEYHDVKSGYGFDWILSSITKEKCGVIHAASMYHPGRHTTYDVTDANKEMAHIFSDVYPKFMKEVYDEDIKSFVPEYKLHEVTLRESDELRID